ATWAILTRSSPVSRSAPFISSKLTFLKINALFAGLLIRLSIIPSSHRLDRPCRIIVGPVFKKTEFLPPGLPGLQVPIDRYHRLGNQGPDRKITEDQQADLP